MTKILIVIGGFMSEGGSEKSLINLLETLTPNKYQLDLLVFSSRGYHYKLIPTYVNKLPLLWELDFYSKNLMDFHRRLGHNAAVTLREELHKTGADDKDLAFSWDNIKPILPEYTGYDIAISYNMGTPMRYIVDKVVAKKKIAWVHFDYRSTYRPPAQSPQMIRDFIDRLDTIVCVTPQNRDSLLYHYPNLHNKIVVVPNINNVQQILTLSKKGYPKEFNKYTFNIFTAARLTFDKGIDTLISTAKLLKNENIDFHWIVAGQKSPGFEQYQVRIEKEDLQKNIELIGFIENPYPYYRFCDLYVQPSPYEGKSVAVEEAKILNCPIVVTNYPSAKDSISHGTNGLICDISAISLADSIKYMISHPQTRLQFKKSLHNSNFDIKLDSLHNILTKN